MSLGDIFKKTLLLPVSVLGDVVTLGGVLEDKKELSTITNLKEIVKEIDKILKE